MQDEKIIELYFKRDEGALVEVSDKYGNYCRSIAWTILNDEETSKECFNDTLYHSWQAIPPKRPNCLKTFLGKITRNVSIKRLEKVYAQKRGGGEAVLAIDELGECVPNAGTTEAERIEEVNAEYEVEENWPGYVVIGSDMGGQLWAYNPEQKIYCQIDSENIGDDACYTQAASFEEFLEKMDAELAGND